MADWYESYASNMDLNVWTSTAVTDATRDEKTQKWVVTTVKGDGSQRVFHVDHLVLSGWVGDPKVPHIPGRVSSTSVLLRRLMLTITS